MMRSGRGSRIVDVDGNEYVDLVMSWGPLIMGHAHPRVVESIGRAAAAGTSFGAPTEIEIRLAELIRGRLPSVELIRFVNSGTEATMSALRLARGFTGRDLIIKFDGCYHGHVDALLVQAGSGALTHGAPTSAGIPADAVETTRVLPYNNTEAFRELMETQGELVAAVIVEPVAGNMGTIPPASEFLETVRDETRRTGALLIFDEVITGFRLGPSGAQGLFGIVPDLTCLGKIIGGGLPVAAFGGRKDVMDLLSPLGPVYQAGTLSGNPLGMAAGLATLELALEGDYGNLTRLAVRLEEGLREIASRYGLPLTVNRCESMLSTFFTDAPVRDLDSVRRSDTSRYGGFFWALLDQGVYLPPSQFETWMLSFAHTDGDVDRVLDAVARTLRDL